VVSTKAYSAANIGKNPFGGMIKQGCRWLHSQGEFDLKSNFLVAGKDRRNKVCFDQLNSIFAENSGGLKIMYWTLELASYLEDAPWPATKDELIDYSIRSGAPLEVVENLQELEDDGQPYESIEEIWPDYPTKEDFFFNEDEY
jgi:hypothetical protein